MSMRAASKSREVFLASRWCSPVQNLFMEKTSLSFTGLAAIIAMTILQACVGTVHTAGTQCAKPTLTPSDASNAITSVTVTIATATTGAYLCYTLDGSTPTGGSSGNGTQIQATRGTVTVTFGVGPTGTTLKAIAYKEGLVDSPIAVGNYVYQSPY
jgi:Chitobiase/beta-hexosaminidase C-terminal domain